MAKNQKVTSESKPKMYRVVNSTGFMFPILVLEDGAHKQVNLPAKSHIETEFVTDQVKNLEEKGLVKVREV